MPDKFNTDGRTLGLSRWGITWALFILMAVTLPSFYFLIQAIVFAPLIAIVWSCFVEQGLAIWAGIHVVIIGLLYFGVAYLVSRMISPKTPVGRSSSTEAA